MEKWISKNLKGFWPVSLGELVDKGIIKSRGGHGSPSQDFRIGDVPYIKVSDLRNRQVNINSTNMVTLETAKKILEKLGKRNQPMGRYNSSESFKEYW